MKKERSLTQRDYETALRWMRRGIDAEWLLRESGRLPQDIVKAADYSYQAKDHQEMGWSGEMRRHRFHAIKHRILTQSEVHPF